MGMGAIWHCIRYVGGLTGDLLPGGTAGGLLLAGTAAGLLLLGTAGAARAQTLSGYFPAGVPGYDTMPGVTVLTRTRPDYQLPGIPVDSFLVSPSIDESLGYDSNVLGGPGSPSSWTLGTAPTVTVRSDWSRDSVAGVLGLDNTRYLDTPQQSRTDATAAFGGTLAVGRDELTLAAAYLDLHEDRTALDAVPSDTPVAFKLFDTRAGYTVALGQLALTPNLDLSNYQYSNTTILGVPASQNYRDRNVLTGGVTARYEIMPLQNALLVLRGTATNYLTPQAGQPTRNSTGALVLVGLSDDRDALWRYRLLFGWEDRQFAANAYSAHSAPVGEADLIWAPNGMTTVTGTLTRSIEDAAQEGVVGYTYTAGKVTIDHEYARDILLQASGGWQQADFLQGGGRQTALLFGLGVTWLVDRHMRVSATYNYNDQQGGGIGTSGPFSRSLGLLTLRYGW
jgi:hypothetical protein